MGTRYPPRSAQPSFIYHPSQDEHFEVMNGAGEKFEFPNTIPHWMHNISEAGVVLLWQVSPAMKTQAFLETMWD